MDELIRKQDALDAFNGEITVAAARNAGRVYTYLKMVTDHIKALPPVYVPEMNVGDMTETDLISRRSVRLALCKAVHKDKPIPCDNQTASCLWSGTRVCDYVREIDALPPVQPKHGKWKDGKCDQCSGSAPFWPLANTYYCSNFCPHCGADMRGEAE